MIQQGNVSKYLTYAIGEILLVVIGILIALSINNWNEENKDRKKETIYLNSLKEEFIDNRDFARLGIEFHNTQIKNAELILASIIGDTSIINFRGITFCTIAI